jgi:hypothetical protein
MMKNLTMWVALDTKGNIQSAWYPGAFTPFRLWRALVRDNGWVARNVELIGDY